MIIQRSQKTSARKLAVTNRASPKAQQRSSSPNHINEIQQIQFVNPNNYTFHKSTNIPTNFAANFPMDLSSKLTGTIVTPTKAKSTDSNRSKLNEKVKFSENLDPNLSSPGLKFTNSPSVIKSEKSAKKCASSNPSLVVSPSPKKKIRERKFVVAKKKSRKVELSSEAAAVACEKCKKAIGKNSKCLCVAYESLRASQEDFFKSRAEQDDDVNFDQLSEVNNGAEDPRVINEGENEGNDALPEENGESGSKRRRDKMLPEPGSGRVMHLVKAFENLQLIKKSGDIEDKEADQVEDNNKGIKWALPGLQQPPKVSESGASDPSFCPSDFFLTSESLGLDSRRSYSLDSSQGSISTRSCAGGRKSRRISTESAGTLNRRYWKRKQQRATSQKPFMLRTEQRGRSKEEEFMKKLQQMMEEEQKLRVPIAQGLPWTTDEPECLVKPPVKEITRPVDLLLHTDTRAVDRAEFDQQVAKKMDLIEQYRMERERQQKLAEEEEIRRLRKELVPKAQPMPYFDRPFIPKREGAKGRAGHGSRPLKVCEAPNNTKRAKVPSTST